MIAVTNATVLLKRLLARARLRHLQTLVLVAELASFRKAGQAIGMTQPAVSQVVADIEALLGVELFQRHARGARPTAICRELLPAARQAIHALGMGLEAVTARIAHGGGTIRLGASGPAMSGLLADALPTFARRHPSIHVRVAELPSDFLGLHIPPGESDLIACRCPVVVPDGWSFTTLREDRYVIACRPEHRLARRRRVTMDELADETWLPPPVSTAARRFFDESFAARGLEPRYCNVTTSATPILWAMLRSQDLIMLLPFSAVRQLTEARQLTTIAIDEPMPFDPLGLLRPDNEPGAAAELLAGFLGRFTSSRTGN